MWVDKMKMMDILAGIFGGVVAFVIMSTMFGRLSASLVALFVGFATLLLTNALRMTRGAQ